MTSVPAIDVGVEPIDVQRIEYPRWPELEKIKISADDYDRLKSSIARGFWPDHPIEVWKRGDDLVVICGCSRLRAVKELGGKLIPAVILSFGTEAQAKIHALQDNVARRQMTPEQLLEAKIAIGALEDEEAAARAAAQARKVAAGQEAGRRSGRVRRGEEAKVCEIVRTPSRTADAIAEDLGVSGRQYEKMLAVRARDPDGWQEILDGRRSTSSAYREMRARDRDRAMAESRRTSGTERAEFLVCDAVDLCRRLGPRSADLLLADPPYSTEIDGDLGTWLDGWLDSVLDVVKDSGRAFLFCGAYPRELLVYLDRLTEHPRLELLDVLVWTYRNVLGPKPRRSFRTNWQAILHLAGPDAGDLDTQDLIELFAVIDLPAPDARREVRHSAWEKPEALAERLIRLTTRRGDLVIDPFAGSGTFGLVAAQMGRRSISCDVDESAIAIAIERGGRLADAEREAAANVEESEL